MNKNPLAIIFITVFIDLVGFGMIIPLSAYLAQDFGATALQVGLLMAIYSAFQFFMSPFWGQVSDRIGRRPVILLSLFVAGCAHILFGLAGSLSWLFVARALAGLGAANISTAMAYISDVTEAKDRSKGMGIIGAAFGLGFVLGPALGGYFSSYGYTVPAFVAGGICLLNFVLAIFVLPESLRKNSQSQVRSGRLGRILQHIRSRSVRNLMFMALVMSLALASIEATLFLLVKERFEWSLTTASYGFAVVGLIMAFTQGFLIRKLLPVYGEGRLIQVGALFFGCGLLVVGMSFNLIFTALAMILVGLGNGLFNPSVLGLVSVRSSSDRQGEVLGVMQSLSALSRILGPPMGGWLYQSFTTGMPFFVGGAFSLSAFVVALFTLKKKNPAAPGTDDFQRIEIFQLENIVNNAVPHRMFFIGQRTSLSNEDQRHPLLQRAAFVPENGAFEAIKNTVQDRSFPIILISTEEAASQKLAQQLESANFVNIYYLKDGVQGLNSGVN